jgi:Ion channel
MCCRILLVIPTGSRIAHRAGRLFDTDSDQRNGSRRADARIPVRRRLDRGYRDSPALDRVVFAALIYQLDARSEHDLRPLYPKRRTGGQCLQSWRGDTHRILGAVALYVLIAGVWAEAYEMISLYVPAAFTGAGGVEEMKDRSTWVYFSFVTLTTVGYGDITPVAHAARSLAIMEALIGQLYPAIVLARLISLSVSKSDPTGDQS